MGNKNTIKGGQGKVGWVAHRNCTSNWKVSDITGNNYLENFNFTFFFLFISNHVASNLKTTKSVFRRPVYLHNEVWPTTSHYCNYLFKSKTVWAIYCLMANISWTKTLKAQFQYCIFTFWSTFASSQKDEEARGLEEVRICIFMHAKCKLETLKAYIGTNNHYKIVVK